MVKICENHHLRRVFSGPIPSAPRLCHGSQLALHRVALPADVAAAPGDDAAVPAQRAEGALRGDHLTHVVELVLRLAKEYIGILDN